MKIGNRLVLSPIAFSICLCCCKTENCVEIGKTFPSYQDAIVAIRKQTYQIMDSIDIRDSKIISRASYYSCNGKVGYFVIKVSPENEFFRRDVPIRLWENFKLSKTKDSFFNDSIDNQYSSGIMTVVEVNP